MLFTDFALHPKLLKAVTECGFNAPSDIQQQAIPHILQGRDIMASAPTGTGKTAAFVLPALQRLHESDKPENPGPRVLVLTPTRELAKQVADNIYMFTKHLRMRSCSIVGGAPYPPQIRLLKQNLDLLVATPGRLIDHIEAGRIDFSNLEMLILDEADRMLDMGFLDDVKRIAALTPRTRQTLLFSATLEGAILKVAQQVLNKPVEVQIAGNRFKHDSITQKLHQADDFRHKHALLSEVLGDQDMNQAIIFTATKRGAEQLAEKLKDDGHRCAALHGDMRQSQRRRTIDQLSGNRLKVLVATDVAARGLDIKGISHVVNFDLPMQAEDYIHRIGRTGRGGATGTAISLVGPQDWDYLSRIEKLIESKLDLSVIAGLEPKKPRPSASSRNSDKGRRKPNIRFKKKSYGNSNRQGGSKSSAASYSRRKTSQAA
ncbi:MAG: DEAD/DEAH box helicase [Gammaproteobacteria bacterium]|nr:DEAD/DEAH box helicase [Gammaproteobacteria bacterium]